MYIFNIYIFLVMNSGAMIAKKHSAPSLSMKRLSFLEVDRTSMLTAGFPALVRIGQDFSLRGNKKLLAAPGGEPCR